MLERVKDDEEKNLIKYNFENEPFAATQCFCYMFMRGYIYLDSGK